MREVYLWILQLVTAVVVFFLLATHMVLMHLKEILNFFHIDIGEPTSWTSMIQRASSGYWLAFYIIFLILVLYHGLYGLRNILIELTPAWSRQVNGLVIALGVVAVVLGIYAPFKLFVS